ncbi:MAG: dihydrofolate reductase family protein [Gaiellaceae bacterium]
MGKLTFDITMSLDGFIAGPNPSLERPLGEGGERLHGWLYGLASFRERHGLEGGTTNADSEILEESLVSSGATLMGRRMFSGGQGPWSEDVNADGWWGDDPPFRMPVFVLTHHPRETLTKGGTSFTFVTGGIEAALEQARAAAGKKDVSVAGGASVAQQYLEAGLLDELQIHLVPQLLGDGVRLFDNLDTEHIELQGARVMHSPSVTHVKYRVVKGNELDMERRRTETSNAHG